MANYMMSFIGMFERRLSRRSKNSLRASSSSDIGRRERLFAFEINFSALSTSLALSITDRSKGRSQAARAYLKMTRSHTMSLFAVEGPAPLCHRERTWAMMSEDLISHAAILAISHFSRNWILLVLLRPIGRTSETSSRYFSSTLHNVA